MHVPSHPQLECKPMIAGTLFCPPLHPQHLEDGVEHRKCLMTFLYLTTEHTSRIVAIEVLHSFVYTDLHM